MKARFVITILLVALLWSAAPISSPPAYAQNGDCLTTFDPNQDYFPDKVALRHTQGFSVEYFKHYKVVIVKDPWPGANQSFRYVLVQCGAPRPEGFTDAAFLTVPAKTAAFLSSAFVAHVDDLDILDRLVGLESFLYVNTPSVVERIKAGKIVELGELAQVNVELTLELDPDLIMGYAIGSPEYDAHPKLAAAGLDVVLNGSWLESSPLARTEWIKFIALFFNREQAAERAFSEVESQYDKLVELARSAAERPTVFTNVIYADSWYMPGGQSYVARMLADAGAAFLWADDPSTGGIPLAFEAVFEQAADADFWVNVDPHTSLKDLLAADSRYAAFKAMQNGNVWNNDLRTNGTGGNDYYETGIARPDLVLADLIKIFHPALLPDHQFTFYRKLE